MIKNTYWIWLAGFIDGEGCIRIAKPFRGKTGALDRGYQLSLSITNTHLFTMKLMGYKLKWILKECKKSSKFTSNRKPIYVCRWNNRKAQEILRKVVPYLITKKIQGELALKMHYGKAGIKISKKELINREYLYKRIKELNQ